MIPTSGPHPSLGSLLLLLLQVLWDDSELRDLPGSGFHPSCRTTVPAPSMLHGHYTDVYEMKYGNSLASSGRFGGSINCDNHAWHVEWMYICVCVSFGVNRPMCVVGYISECMLLGGR